MRQILASTVLAGLMWVLPCGACPANGAPPGNEAAAEDWRPEAISDERLHNAFWVHEKVISGGVPDQAGMQALCELGVKTIISVDGARPEVALAKRHGLRYVHLPHGYDGISRERMVELAKAVRDLEGPIYIHCHHGKHRSPAAAATACIAAGLIPPDRGLPVLQTAGTSANYRGLYASVADARPLEATLLDRADVAFRETADVPPLAEAMVALEKTHDELTWLSENRWKPTPAHPDLAPDHEALLLREHLAEMLRTEEVQAEPEEFRRLLRASEKAAEQLEEALRSLAERGATERAASATAALQRVSQNCKTCHRQYRDLPLDGRAAP